MSDTHCSKHGVRWYDLSPDPEKTDWVCIKCIRDERNKFCQMLEQKEAENEDLLRRLKIVQAGLQSLKEDLQRLP